MKIRVKFVIIFTTIISISSCTQRPGVTDDFPEVIQLASHEKDISDAYMKYPFRVRLQDSILYIMDLHGVDYYCHQFSYPSMQYIGPLIKRGEAPDEFLDAENIRVDSISNVWVLDTNKKIMADLSAGTAPEIEKKINLSEDLIRILDFDFYNDSVYIVPDYSGENRICLIGNNGQILEKYFTIPAKNTDAKGIPLAQGWRSFLSYNPQNGIMAMVTQLGEVVEIYDLKKKKLINVVYGTNSEPQFIVKEGFAIPKGIMGYSDVWVGKASIYAIFWGNSLDDAIKGKVKKEGGAYIHVFDLQGKPLRKYILDRPITGFCVDEEHNRIIGLDINSDQPVIEFQMKQS